MTQKIRRARDKLTIVPIIICLFLLSCLFAYLILQGNMQDWVSFMHGEASMALFGLYSAASVAGIVAVFLFKKDTHILEAPRKLVTIAFITTIVIGWSVFTYLNFTATQANYDWMHDGLLYQQMGQSWLQNREFIVDGVYTHHFAPVYPIYLSLFYMFFEVHIGTQIAVEILFSLSIVTVFLVTKKIYGFIPALFSTVLVITIPSFLFASSRNYAEPMVLILYTLTIFFILESLKPEKGNRIILAGLFAALGFLTKASVGYFFIITGITGFLWRFYYMRWRVFKNKNYLGGITIFLALVLSWITRNLVLFWDGTLSGFFSAAQPSQYLNDAIIHSLTKDLGSSVIEFWFFAVLSAMFLMPYVWMLSPYIKRVASRIRDERVSCLLLAIMLPVFIGLAMGAFEFIYENAWMDDYLITYYPVSQVRYLTLHLIRYLFIALVPLSWLAFEFAKVKRVLA